MTGVTLHIPTLETARLRLRAPRWEDFDAVVAYSLSERSRTVGGPVDRAQAFARFCALGGHWLVRGYGRWVIADRQTDAALGISGPYFPEGWPEPEIAWTVFEGAEGRSIAYEAACAVRAHLYDTLGWRTVMSAIDPANTRSVRLAERLGCRREGQFDTLAHGRLDIWRHPGPEEIRP